MIWSSRCLMKLKWSLLFVALLISSPLIAVLNITNVVNPVFGDVLSGASGRNFILGTNGLISGANSGDYISGASAGSLLITGDQAQSISIIASNLTANGGITIANVTCNYDNTGDVNCVTGLTGAQPTVGGKTLLIGLEINTTQTHSDNDAPAPTFDIDVIFI